jgi:hypothetical protein
VRSDGFGRHVRGEGAKSKRDHVSVNLNPSSFAEADCAAYVCILVVAVRSPCRHVAIGSYSYLELSYSIAQRMQLRKIELYNVQSGSLIARPSSSGWCYGVYKFGSVSLVAFRPSSLTAAKPSAAPPRVEGPLSFESIEESVG